MTSTEKALKDLLESLYTCDRNRVNDSTWWAAEVAAWVLEGYTYNKALSKFLDSDEPKLIKNIRNK